MNTTINEIVFLWLLGLNILLMVFIIIDRFLLIRKKSIDLEDQFVRDAIKNLHAQIKETNLQLSKNTVAFQERSQTQTLELLANIRTNIFQRYEQEFRLIDEAVKKNINNIEVEVTSVLGEVRKSIDINHANVEQKYNSTALLMEAAAKSAIEDMRKHMAESTQHSNEQLAVYMQEQIDHKIEQITADVLRNSISLRDHERLIENAINEYIKSRS